MGKTALLIVFVNSQQLGSDFSAGLLQSLTESLKDPIAVQVVDRETSSLEISEVRRVRVTIRAQAVTVERVDGPSAKMQFKPKDRYIERGRATGFLIASLFPDWKRPPPPSETSDTVLSDASNPAPAAESSTPKKETVPEFSAPPIPQLVPEPPPQPKTAPQNESNTSMTPNALHLGLELRGGAALAVVATAGGGSLEFLLSPFSRCWARVGASSAVGGVRALNATAVWVRPFGGATCEWLWGGWGTGAGIDLGASGLFLRRSDETKYRWVASPRVALSFSRAVGPLRLVFAPSIHFPLGETHLTLNGTEVSTFPPFEAWLELGLRYLH